MQQRVDIQNFLSQMRHMRELPNNIQNMNVGQTQQGGNAVEFGKLLKSTLSSVNETQMEAGRLKESYEMGDKNISLAEIMVASQKANVSFQAVTHVRNHFVNAYQEIFNMSV